MNSRFLIAFLIIVLALVLQMRLFEPAGFPLPLSLAAILALTLLMDVGSIVFLSLFSFFILNWRPGITPEFTAFVCIPLVACFVQSFFPLRSALNAAGVGALGVALWYVAANPSGTFAAPSLILFKAILSGFVAAFVFGLFRFSLRYRS